MLGASTSTDATVYVLQARRPHLLAKGTVEHTTVRPHRGKRARIHKHGCNRLRAPSTEAAPACERHVLAHVWRSPRGAPAPHKKVRNGPAKENAFTSMQKSGPTTGHKSTIQKGGPHKEHDPHAGCGCGPHKEHDPHTGCFSYGRPVVRPEERPHPLGSAERVGLLPSPAGGTLPLNSVHILCIRTVLVVSNS